MIELEIFFNTDETEILDNLELPVDWEDYEIRKVTFFNINAVSPRRDNLKYSVIHCNGDSFICNLSKEEVIKLIINK